ncbi:bifunctional enoyl-CoA hydratase/phosphate acetyltransferase [Clostridium grantii]|uniref:Phosphate butyryltransferase n=1 Tax=Clostridium grantii DSM 8605 TaxID=1121316 RepID=A0A1M5TNA8_9CLOT|nr:bifunctional enoyl-CoA hydratase/phosphate acetyltransferase [Clostridium grantii]SHH52150.1 phosphate butyryltransferase [Clostridium grantii DSM 8605]
MEFKNFNELVTKVKESKSIRKVAVVSAQDKHTLEAVFKAKNDGLIFPILIGDKKKIQSIINSLGEELASEWIINVESDSQAAYKAVEIIRNGEADFIMKGKIQTSDLLKAVVDKDKGLRTNSIMSHISINEIPSYHKLLAVTDGGMMMYPDLTQKKSILENAVNTFINMGYENPKVAVLSAVEVLNPKMIETVDAAALKEMNLNGEIKNCLVEGPISYDLAMNKESALIKGFQSEVTENVDILIVPNITTGNILAKSLIYSAHAKMAGFIVGAKVPIVLTSRGSSSEEKYLSLALSASSVK